MLHNSIWGGWSFFWGLSSQNPSVATGLFHPCATRTTATLDNTSYASFKKPSNSVWYIALQHLQYRSSRDTPVEYLCATVLLLQ